MLGTALLRIFCHAVAGPCSVVPTTALERKRYRRVRLSLNNFVLYRFRAAAGCQQQSILSKLQILHVWAGCLRPALHMQLYQPSCAFAAEPKTPRIRNIPDDEVVPGGDFTRFLMPQQGPAYSLVHTLLNSTGFTRLCTWLIAVCARLLRCAV